MEGKKTLLAGSVFDPRELVAYQDGTVVSRAVVTKKAGTITAFAFDAGEGLSEHTAPYDAVVQILEGEAEITVGGRPYTLAAGEMIPRGFIYTTPGFSDERVYLFEARNLLPSSEFSPDDDEQIEVVRVPLADLAAMCRDGRISDAKTIAILFRCLA